MNKEKKLKIAFNSQVNSTDNFFRLVIIDLKKLKKLKEKNKSSFSWKISQFKFLNWKVDFSAGKQNAAT